MSDMKVGVTVILVNYGSYDDTVEALGSVLASEGVEVRVLVVDNASPDSSGARIAERFSGEARVEVVLSPENLGFGGANNLGMARAFSAGASFALLLNNDTVVDPRMVGMLLEACDGGSVCAPLMLYHSQPDVIWCAGGRFDGMGYARHLQQGCPRDGVGGRVRPTEWITGCCMLVPRAAYEATGGFDEAYFLYWEDVDWSIRLSKAGFKLLVVPEAALWHKVSSSTGRIPRLVQYYSRRNFLYAIDKLELGVIPWAVARLGVLRHGLLKCGDEAKVARRAYADYRSGRMGRVEGL